MPVPNLPISLAVDIGTKRLVGVDITALPNEGDEQQLISITLGDDQTGLSLIGERSDLPNLIGEARWKIRDHDGDERV